MLACGHRISLTTRSTTITSVFDDINSREGIDTPIWEDLLGLTYLFPINYLLPVRCWRKVQYFVFSDCLTLIWRQSARGAMETSFVYFQVLKRAVHQICFYMQCNDRKLIFRTRPITFKKRSYFKVMFLIMRQLGIHKSCWCRQVERE